MDITLRNGELIEAITNYVRDKGIDLTDKNVTVSFLAGRGGNGNSAIIEINSNNSENVKTSFIKTKTNIKPKAKRGSKSKVKSTPFSSVTTMSDEDVHMAAKKAAKATEAPMKGDEVLKSVTGSVTASTKASDDMQEEVKVTSDGVFANTSTDTDEISDNKSLFAS